MGDSPKWVKSKKRRKKKREKEREKERLNDGDNNGQATHCNATSCGARKAAWAKNRLPTSNGSIDVLVCNFQSNFKLSTFGGVLVTINVLK